MTGNEHGELQVNGDRLRLTASDSSHSSNRPIVCALEMNHLLCM